MIKKVKDIYLKLSEKEFTVNFRFNRFLIGGFMKELPNEVFITPGQLMVDTDDEYDDFDTVNDYVLNYLSGEYGFCINSLSLEVKKDKTGNVLGVKVWNIDWDTTE